MKNRMRNMIVLMVLAMTSIQAVALTSEMPHDTIYFYNTWEQMFNEEPVIALVDRDDYPL